MERVKFVYGLLLFATGALCGALSLSIVSRSTETRGEDLAADFFERARSNNLWLFKASVESGMSVNALDASGHNSILMEAVSSGANDVVRYLLANGAEADTRRDDEMTAFLLAARECNGVAAKMLAEADPFLGADADYRRYALQLAKYDYYTYERDCSAEPGKLNEWEGPARTDCGFWLPRIEPPCSGVIDIVLSVDGDASAEDLR